MLRVFNNTARYVDQCVKPETLIYTTHGPLKIQDVTINETEVYNLNGEVETIDNVLEHPYSGDLIKLKIQHSIDNLEITGEHPLYILKNQKRGLNYSTIKNIYFVYLIHTPTHACEPKHHTRSFCFFHIYVLFQII